MRNHHIWQQAEYLLRSEDIAQARLLYESLAATPDFAAPANLRLSLIAGQQGRYRAVVSHALSAFAARSADVDLLEMLGKRLLSVGEFHAGFVCAEELMALQSGRADAYAELGKLMLDAFMPDVAARLLDRAITLGLDTAGTRYLLGLSRFYAGSTESAEDALERALHMEPSLAHAHLALSKLHRYTVESNHVQRLRAAIRRGGYSRQDAALFHYALFKELDDIGDIEAAWVALDDGMRIRRSTLRYDSVREQALYDHLSRMPIRPKGPVPASDDIVPIFIIGLPRTGSTLLEVKLSQHRDIAMAGELHDAMFQLRWMCDSAGGMHLDMDLARKADAMDLGEYGRRYLEHARWRIKGCRFYTDKMPGNLVNVGYLAQALPRAVFLHMVRNPMDTCFSNLKEMFAGFYPHSYDQAEMAEHYARSRRLMARWHECFPGRILDVSYERLVSDPDGVVGEVLNFCGLNVAASDIVGEGKVGTVATASAMQVREPIHTRSVQQWRRYERQLQPLRLRLQELGVEVDG